MGATLGPGFPSRLGLAVSGGGDSMAMLHLCANWARVYGVGLAVVTVDHGLRPESAAEAQLVADEAAGLGLPHETLHWTWDRTGNLQDAARRGRRALIGTWAQGRTVLMGHTRDDQAETLLMRLARGSGVDGLAAMSPLASIEDWRILRPLLDVGRAELRHYLKVLNIPFADDPSNEDPAYARVRMRRLIGQEGLESEKLAATTHAMARAREALGARALQVARGLLRDTIQGCVALDRDGLSAVEEETRLRILAGAIGTVSGQVYRPRLSALTDLVDRVLSGGTATLQGVIVVPKGDTVFLSREWQAVCDRAVSADLRWDGRWRVEGPIDPGLTLRALGEAGLTHLGPRPDDAPPRACLAGLPSIWEGERLLACPALQFGPPFHLKDRLGGSFPQDLLVH
nr:tRNA lysidine(34) synthetase TilS [Salipiger sp. IMCC34102]